MSGVIRMRRLTILFLFLFATRLCADDSESVIIMGLESYLKSSATNAVYDRQKLKKKMKEVTGHTITMGATQKGYYNGNTNTVVRWYSIPTKLVDESDVVRYNLNVTDANLNSFFGTLVESNKFGWRLYKPSEQDGFQVLSNMLITPIVE